ncbi:MAG: glycosyl hydrolase, partial [Planctomycetota bacterium]
PISGIHKSTDGGNSWRALTNGLPSGDVGKISLAVSPQNSNVVYATIELPGRSGGFWRSENGGASWSKLSDYVGGGTGPHYYQEIWADPHQEGVIYQANVVLGRSEDGGRNWQGIGNDNKHVDNHAVAFHPTDPSFLLVGCDGGLYKSWDRGATYALVDNLPLTQFYKVDVDYDWPVYHVVGGTQDNNTQYGPTRALNENGIRNADWRITIGGDGHDCAIDPQDPNIIYCESQQGYLSRFDRRTGESVRIRPEPEKGESNLRFNWDAPIHISPHSHTRLYFASNRLHRSDDRGDSWRTISPDLSRQRMRYSLPIMGRVWSIDATWDVMAMSQHSNITSISESPLQEGLIYVGTDDGLIWVTEDGGENWRKIERIWGVPELAFVNDIKADLHDVNTVYACLDNHKEGDYRPFLIKSEDKGATWTSLAADLPDRHLCWRIIQDHEKADLLFLATELGIFTTLDGGQHWLKMSGGLPTISFRDLEIQRRENDLVGASFGRSFYVLDDYSPLRHLDEAMLEKDLVIFPIKTAWLYEPEDILGGRRGSQGDGYYSADNPPYGAVFTYHLKEGSQTQRQERRKREQALAKKGEDTPFPGWDALKEEEREESPSMWLEIRDTSGQVVNRVTAPTRAGLNRVTWNLRTAGAGRRGGPRALPGRYTVQAFRRISGETLALGEPASFEVEAIGTPSLPPQDRAEVLAWLEGVGELQRAIGGAQSALGEALEEVRAMKDVLDGSDLDFALYDEARRLELALMDAGEKLSGDPTPGRYEEVGDPSILSRLRTAYFGSFGQSYGPTQTHRRQVEIAKEEYAAVKDDIRSLVETDVEELKKKLDAAGAPWTPGRQIPAIDR